MARQPKLRKKKVGKTTYWYTETGGETYFGNVDSLPYSEARNQFNQHVINVMDAQKNSKTHELTAGELMDFFLDWIEKHRSQRTYSTRKTHCTRFGKFGVKGMKITDEVNDAILIFVNQDGKDVAERVHGPCRCSY